MEATHPANKLPSKNPVHMKILLVEKELELRDIYVKMVIENLGDVDIDAESDGDEALTRYSRHGPYDLVLTDDYHEGLDGVEFVKAIRNINPAQKMAALTLDKEMGQRLWREFRIPYLKKPLIENNCENFCRK